MHRFPFFFCAIGMVGALRGGSRALPVARISDINRIATPVRFNPLERFKACQLRSEVGDTVESKVDLQRTLGWIGAAGVFSLGIALTKGSTSAVEFLAGYVLEQSLSVDNLFVFLVLFDYFGVDSKQEEKILNYGILGAILLRGIFIALGSVALENFHQVLLVFAGILFYSAYKIVFAEDDGEEEDIADNAVINFSKKFLSTTDKFDGNKFFTLDDGKTKATPLFLCLLSVEFSDIVFAFDSVPAVFGVTSDPLIVFSSNIFAIASLRSLYGVLSKAVAELEYLEKAVGVVLAVIAIKLSFSTFGIEILDPVESLFLVLSILGLGIGFSLKSKS